MLTHQTIGASWSLVVDSDFQRGTDAGDVVLWKQGRTIHASVFKTNQEDAEVAIEKMIEGRPGIPVQMFDRDEPGLAGHAYLLPETGANGTYWGLNTWTAAQGEVACVTFYFDDLAHLNWAMTVWKSVRPREGTVNLN